MAQSPPLAQNCYQHTRSKRWFGQTRSYNILKRRIIEHLREVDKSKLGKPRRSIHIYIKESNKNFPQNNPICTAILFKEEDYFFDEKTKSHFPPGGWRFEVFYLIADHRFSRTTD
jgi:hypothetical protein